MSADGSDPDLGGFLPPHELRALLATVGDRSDASAVPVMPGPAAAHGSPGLAGAAVAPPPGAPSLPEADPNALALVLARMAGELFGGASVVPAPMSNLGTAPGLAASPLSPGISPQLVPYAPDAATPQIPAGQGEPPLPGADVAGAPTTPNEIPTSHGWGGGSYFQNGTPSFGGPAFAPPSTPSPSPTAAPSHAPTPSQTPSWSQDPSQPQAQSWAQTTQAPTSAQTPSRAHASQSQPSPSTQTPSWTQTPSQHPPSTQTPSWTRSTDDLPSSLEAPSWTTGWHPADAAVFKPATTGVPGAQPAATVATSFVPDPPAGVGPWPGQHVGSVPLVDAVSGQLPPFGGVGSALAPPHTGAIAIPAHEQRLPIIDSAGTAFDPYRARRDFPILGERVHGGKRLVWLDNAATTQKPRAVIERLSHYYEHENSNVHRAAHVLAARATDAFESARDTTRKFLNASSPSEIVFVRGATEGINLIAKTWGRRTVLAGDEIVLTHLEHHANIVPWQQLCAEVGARLRVAPVDDRGDVILEEYEKLLCARTKLVAFTQVSNALGTITPAREMIEIAHRHGAIVLLDGAQAVSHMHVDVQQLDCDFYVFSGHKVFAPTGIGAVYGKRALLDDMPPWQGGGNMIADVTFERTTYQPPPGRFEAGTGNIADAAGMGAALDYVMRIGMNVIDRYEHELLVYATERLAAVPGLRMIGTSAHKAGVLSFVLAGQRTEDVGAALDKHGIAVRSGHHCAQPILRRFGVESSVRASLAFYNVREDIDALVDALHQLQAR